MPSFWRRCDRRLPRLVCSLLAVEDKQEFFSRHLKEIDFWNVQMVQGKRKWGIGPINDFIEQHGLREKFDALTPPNVATVAYRDASFKFYIPDAMTDKMQLAPLLG